MRAGVEEPQFMEVEPGARLFREAGDAKRTLRWDLHGWLCTLYPQRPSEEEERMATRSAHSARSERSDRSTRSKKSNVEDTIRKERSRNRRRG